MAWPALMLMRPGPGCGAPQISEAPQSRTLPAPPSKEGLALIVHLIHVLATSCVEGSSYTVFGLGACVHNVRDYGNFGD